MTLFGAGLALHVVTGMTALVAGPVAMTARKGGSVHRAAGRTFAASMLIAAAVALPLAVAVRSATLMGIAVFTLMLVSVGWRSIVWRRRPGWRPRAWDWAVPVIALAFALSLLLHGLHGNAVAAFFAVLVTVLAVNELRALRHSGTDWLRHHLVFMLAGYLATATAFLVVNVSFLPSAVVFIAPTLIGVPLIVRTAARHAPRVGA